MAKMDREADVPLFDLVGCLSEVIDLVSPAVSDHHKRVAYIALGIASEQGAPIEQQHNVMLAGMVHDIGALSLADRLHNLRFEITHPDEHAERGWLLLKSFEPFSTIADLVRYHHHWWGEGGTAGEGERVPLGSHVLHLADRVSVLLDKEQEILGQVQGICGQIKEQSGRMFAPQLVDAFLGLAAREYFWLDSVSPSLGSLLAQKAKSVTLRLNTELLLSLAKLFSRIIDFRSRFTATHSSGVAACAEALSRLAGLSDKECTMMRIAGYLHDLGKLGVPIEILEKPGPLTPEERNLIRVHTYHSYRILQDIHELDDINFWASSHHERLDGTGYPFHLDSRDLLLANRIMAVADTFTAVIEDRPYRKGMAKDQALQLLQSMALSRALDPNVVSLLDSNFEEVDSCRVAAQAEVVGEYEAFRTHVLGGESRSIATPLPPRSRASVSALS